MKIKLLIIALLFIYVAKAQQPSNSGTNASVTTAQMMQILQMDSSQYTVFKANLKLFRDSVRAVLSDSTLSREYKLNSIELINTHRHTYLQASLTPQQLAAYNLFEQTRAQLSPRRRNEE